jgi:hypothetical protein
MLFQIVHALVDVVNDFYKLLAGRRESWVLKALYQVIGLREMLQSEFDVFADLTQLPLLSR